jgi:CRISPR-associated Csx2 family protein
MSPQKVFISFLGTSNYQEVNYAPTREQAPAPVRTRFVQQATLHFHCQGWTEQDEVLVLLTREAREKNWEDHTFPDPKTKEPKTGLAKVLAGLGLRAAVKPIDISDGKSEDEIWKVFRAVFEAIPEGAHVVFDITHGFRSSPMLTMVLINYAKFLKNIKVLGIYYGALEAKEGERVPLWELTAFSTLQDWTSAANEFVNFGSANRLHELAQASSVPEIKNQGDKAPQAIRVKRLSEQLKNAVQYLATNRGGDISGGKSFDEIKNSLEELKNNDFIVPFTFIFDKISSKIADFETNTVFNCLPAVQFCIDHGLTQQGITQLHEGVVSLVLHDRGRPWKVGKLQKEKEVLLWRELASSALNYLNANAEKKAEWKVDNDKKTRFDQLVASPLAGRLAKAYAQLVTYRNDINHGGYVQTKKADEFTKALGRSFGQVKQVVQDYFSSPTTLP